MTYNKPFEQLSYEEMLEINDTGMYSRPDNPAKSVSEIHSESRREMQKHKKRAVNTPKRPGQRKHAA